MSITPELMERVLKGNLAFSHLGLSLLVTRQKNLYKTTPTQATLQRCITELAQFMDKFKPVLGEDLKRLESLN
jgi:hypothetical protein